MLANANSPIEIVADLKGKFLAVSTVGSLPVIFARKAFIKGHPKELDDFLKGVFATIAFMHQHKAETVKDADKVLHASAAVMNKVYDFEMPMLLTNGEFNSASLKTIKQSWLSMKILKSVPPDDEVLSRQFLPVKF